MPVNDSWAKIPWLDHEENLFRLQKRHFSLIPTSFRGLTERNLFRA